MHQINNITNVFSESSKQQFVSSFCLHTNVLQFRESYSDVVILVLL